jgi:flagellar biosynthetic protein FliQ
MDWMPQAIREGIFTIIFISGPLVVLAAVLGLSVGIVQAATQIQEQTLASAVKIIGLFLALIVFGFYMFQYLRQYTAQNLQKAFRLVPTLGTYAKPRQNFLSIKEEGRTQETGVGVPTIGSMEPTGSSTGAMIDELNQPDISNINVGQKPESLGAPKGQLKEDNENVRKIEDQFKSVDRSNIINDNSSQTNSSPAPSRTEAVVRPAPARRSPPAEPTVRPKPRPRKSLTGALDKIRASLEDSESN